MSEVFNGGQEFKESVQDTNEALKNPAKSVEKELTQTEKQHGTENHIDTLSKSVEKQAISGKETAKGEHSPVNHHPVLINKQLKDMAFSRALTRARKKLPLPDRAFSRVIHNPVIDRSSDFVGKTIARPTPLLSGAFLAFIGSTALLWISRHYGYRYNYLVTLILFFGGAIIGLFAEILWKMAKKIPKR